jgi:phenylpropionate dioxygenase-like ring-hydroxylating dioxygenase large terminal subunit
MTAPLRSPIPIHHFDPSALGADPVIALPPAVFNDPTFHSFEMNAVWSHEWFCIGRASDIPNPGDFTTLTVGDDPLIVVRDRTGTIHVLSNVCQHRGMILVEGSGNARRFSCPLHAWTYALDGRLAAAPGLSDDPARKDDLAKICLPRIRSEIWEGFIFITFDTSIAPVAERLAHLSVQLANYRMSELRAPKPLSFEAFDWNWKIFNDECYHCGFLHNKSWGSMYALNRGVVDEFNQFNDQERGIFSYDLRSTHVDAAPTHTKSILQPPLPGLTLEERQRLSYVTVAPNLLIVAMPDKVKFFLWLPAGPQKSFYGVSWIYPESTLVRPTFQEDFDREVRDLGPVMEEDIHAWSSCQKGMNSRFAGRGVLSRDEEIIKRLQTWLVDRYRAEDARAAQMPVAAE